MDPPYVPKLTEPFSTGERLAAQMAITLGPMAAICIGAYLFWRWMIPLDPAWTPPPQSQTIVVSGAFASATDALQPRGYDFVTVGGLNLRLRCEPYADASPTTKDNCLAGKARLGDYAGRHVVVRYYEIPAEVGTERILLSARAGQRWLLRPEEQTTRLAAGGDLERSHEITWRTHMTILGSILPLTLAFYFLPKLRRRKARKSAEAA